LGGARLATRKRKRERVVDVRTGATCAYRELDGEVERLEVSARIPWAEAARRIATLANADEDAIESILHNLRLWRKRRPGPPAVSVPAIPAEAAAVPGFGWFLQSARQRLTVVRAEVDRQHSLPLAKGRALAGDLAALRTLLEARSAALQTVVDPGSAAAALKVALGTAAELPASILIVDLVEGERAEVAAILGAIRSLQSQVDTLRADPTHRDF